LQSSLASGARFNELAHEFFIRAGGKVRVIACMGPDLPTIVRQFLKLFPAESTKFMSVGALAPVFDAFPAESAAAFSEFGNYEYGSRYPEPVKDRLSVF